MVVIGESPAGGGAPSVTGTSVTLTREPDGCAGAAVGAVCAAFAGVEPWKNAPMVNATISRNPNVRTPRRPLRVRGSSDATCSTADAGWLAGTGWDCHQLQ